MAVETLFAVVKDDEDNEDGGFLVDFLMVDRFPGDERGDARGADAVGLTGAESERSSLVR